MFVLLVRNLFLDGCWDGIRFYLTVDDWQRLAKTDVRSNFNKRKVDMKFSCFFSKLYIIYICIFQLEVIIEYRSVDDSEI